MNVVQGQGRYRDLVASCPGCATLETLAFQRDSLIPTRRFSQRDGRVYHDCGTNRPCLLFPRWKEPLVVGATRFL